MNAHQLDADGVILNTIVVDSLDVLPDLVDAAIGGSIGDIVDRVNNVVIPAQAPAPEVPQAVAMWQAREILIDEGLLDDVYAYFETIGDPKEKRKAISKFETSSRVYRNDPLVLYVIPLMGKSEADIDEMFRRAAAL